MAEEDIGSELKFESLIVSSDGESNSEQKDGTTRRASTKKRKNRSSSSSSRVRRNMKERDALATTRLSMAGAMEIGLEDELSKLEDKRSELQIESSLIPSSSDDSGRDDDLYE